jgi:ATP-binding cassette subfamily B protein
MARRSPFSPVLFPRLRRLAPFVAPFWGRIAVVFFLSLAGTVLGLLWPLFTKILIDDVLLARDTRLLLVLAGAMVAATAVGYGAGALGRYLYTQVTARVLFALRRHVFDHVQRLPMAFHAKSQVGDVLSRLGTDIARVQSVLTDAALALVANALVLAATVGFLLWLNWRLFLLVAVVVPLQVWSVLRVRPYVVGASRRLRERSAELSSFLVESLSAIRFVKLFCAERGQGRKLDSLGERLISAAVRVEMVNYLGSMASTATTFVGGLLTFVVGGYLVVRGDMSVGSLIAFSAYQSRALSPLRALMDLYLRIERAGVSLDRIYELLAVAPEPAGAPWGTSDGVLGVSPTVEPQAAEPGPGRASAERAHAPAEAKGAVEFREVSFLHEGREKVLEDVSFAVPAGGRLAVLGSSGAGKTTLADLLVRLYEPTSGLITLDGRDIRGLDLQWLRSQVLIVGHDPFIFNAGLAENIRLARPEASDDDMVEAAEAARLHDFVGSLPRGYETVVGERGTRLSAGQRQRVAIARAVLRRPAVLVLDEATSALDAATEREVRAALDELMAGRTLIVITHRLASIRGLSQVLVLGGGRVVWRGGVPELFDNLDGVGLEPGTVIDWDGGRGGRLDA